MGLVPGVEVEVEVGPPAHGGFCVARHEGQVLFVRHTLPGERVRARVTEGAERDRFVRADAVEILLASPDRVSPPCPYAGPGGCGGCDLQHVSLPAQRAWKAAVVAEQQRRLARRDVFLEVEPVAGDRDGLAWRTRVELAVGPTGRPGLRRHRSHDVVAVARCDIATDAVNGLIPGLPDAEPGAAFDLVAPSVGEPVVVPVPSYEPVPMVAERVGEDVFEVSARGFWQVHPGAATTFAKTVVGLVQPRPGERCLDLYAGVGLFALSLAREVGPSGAVIAVESDAAACASAEENLAGLGNAVVIAARVDDALGAPRARKGPRRGAPRRSARAAERGPRAHPLMPPSVDVVVLDPPRTGAGREVLAQIVARQPRVLAYVACDPAALARDTAYLADLGWELTALRAFDAFPMTHHLECIARFEPGA